MTIEFWILLVITCIGAIRWGFFVWQEKIKEQHTLWATKKKSWSPTTKEKKEIWLYSIEQIEIAQPTMKKLYDQLTHEIIWQPGLIKSMIVAVCSQKHLFIQSLPGMAKTRAVKALAHYTWLDMGRIQWTPDLLPSDIIGKEILSTDKKWSEIHYWPIVHQIILFDEINRTTPKVQSALMECMEEWQVTIAHTTVKLPEPFILFATSNPQWSKGIYELPEAQMDRFWLSITLDYPHDEHQIINNQSPKDISNHQDTYNIQDVQQHIEKVTISDELIHYITNLVQQTRSLDGISVWCSPRAGKDMVRLSKTVARLADRGVVEQGDIDNLIEAVRSHRVSWKQEFGGWKNHYSLTDELMGINY